MKRDNTNINFHNAIIKKIPHKTELVNRLTDILKIEKEAIYRRLRGDVSFSFTEVAIIAEKLGLSLDELIGIQPEKKRSFQLRLTNFVTPQESDYMIWENYIRILEMFNQTGKLSIYETWDSIPFPFGYNYPALTRFYIFKWAFQVNNNLNTTKFCNITVDNKLQELALDSLKQYQSANLTQLILSDTLFENLAKNIRFFRKVHLLSPEDLQELICEMEQFISYLEELASQGVYPETGKRILLYISEIDMQTPYSLLEANGNYISILRTLVLSGAATTDETTFEYMKNWFSALKRLSNHISISGEKERINFFEKQREILNSLKKEFS